MGIKYRGIVLSTFGEVMRAFPYQQLWELLENPRAIDREMLELVWAWMRTPSVSKTITIAEAVVVAKLLPSKSAVRQAVRDKALRLNGQLVEDATALLTWLDPGWAVLKFGKKQHVTVMDERL